MTAAKGKDSTSGPVMPADPDVDPVAHEFVDVADNRGAAIAALLATNEVAQGNDLVNLPAAAPDYSPTGTVHTWSAKEEAKRFLVKARWYARNLPVVNWEGKNVLVRHQAYRGDVVVLDESPEVSGHVAQGYLAPVKE